MCGNVVFCLIIILFLDNGIFAMEKSRQKRCIVIQKQSGGKADSGEGSDDEDYDYKKPQPKVPPPDRLRYDKNEGPRNNEVETITPELLKYKVMPDKAKYRRLRLRNRLLKNNFAM